MVHDARVRSDRGSPDRSPLAQEAVSLHDPHPVISFHERLPRRLVAVPRARKLAADALTTAGEPGAGDDLALVITELVANAVRHGRGRRISMRLEADGRSVRVEVENRRWTTLPGGDSPRTSAPAAAASRWWPPARGSGASWPTAAA